MRFEKQDSTHVVIADVPGKYIGAIKAHFDPKVEVSGDRVRFPKTKRNVRLTEKMGVDVSAIEIPSATTVAHERNVEKMKAMDHQAEWIEKFKERKFFGLLWEMGLGKSKAAIDIAAHAYAEGEIDAILVVTLKGVHEKWINVDFPEHLSIGYRAFAWPTKKTRDKGFMEEGKLVCLSVNYDSLIHKAALEYTTQFLENRRVFMIVDESHGMKSPKGARAKTILKLARKAYRRCILTGTISPHSPLDLWTQLSFLDPSIVHGLDYFNFEKRFAVKRKMGNMTYTRRTKNGRVIEKPIETVVGYRNVDELKAWMAPHVSRLMKEDCLDLPPKVYRTHPFSLTSEEASVYRKMKDDMMAEIGDSVISTTHAMTLLLRLQQITCGFIKTDDGRQVRISKESSRMTALKEWIEDCHGQGVIWTTFQFNQDEIAEYLGEDCVQYTGRTSPEDRLRALDDFRAGKARFMVSNPASGGTGIDLRAARHVCYFNNAFNLGQRLQSEDRVHRIGQRFSIDYTDLAAYKTIDAKIIKALRERREIAADLVGDVVRNWIITADEVDMFNN